MAETTLEKKSFVQYVHNFFSFFRKPMFRYIIKRSMNAVITMFFIITAVFILMRMIPKERYINYDIYNKVPTQNKENYKLETYHKYGLDKPIIQSLLEYYWDILPVPKNKCVKDTYELGTYNLVCRTHATVFSTLGDSAIVDRGTSVISIISEKFPISFKLNIFALVLTYIVSYPLGVFMAKNKGKLTDKIGNGYIIATIAVPSLIIYYIIMALSMRLLHLPSIFDEHNLLTWITPIFAIAFISSSGTSLWVRRFMVDEMNSDYVKFARSKGLSERRIMFTHVLRNAIVPIIRNVPAALIYTVIGSYYVENLWVIPGSGKLLISALNRGDIPLVMGLTIVYAAMSMIAFLLGDIVTVFFDPRISLTKNK